MTNEDFVIITGTVEQAEGLVKSLRALSPELMLFLVMIVIGLIIKTTPIPNRLRGPISILGAPLLFVVLIGRPTGDVPPGAVNPAMWNACIGLLIGAAAWLTHDKLIDPAFQMLGNKLPFLRPFLEKLNLHDPDMPVPPTKKEQQKEEHQP